MKAYEEYCIYYPSPDKSIYCRFGELSRLGSFRNCDCRCTSINYDCIIYDLDKYLHEFSYLPMSILDEERIIGDGWKRTEERKPVDIVSEIDEVMKMSFELFKRMLAHCRFYYNHRHKAGYSMVNSYFMIAPKLIRGKFIEDATQKNDYLKSLHGHYEYLDISKSDIDEQINHFAWFIRNTRHKYQDYDWKYGPKLYVSASHGIYKSMNIDMNVSVFFKFICETKIPTTTLKMHVIGIMIVKTLEFLLTFINDDAEKYQELLNGILMIIDKKKTKIFELTKKNVFREWLIDYAKKNENENDVEVKITDTFDNLRKR